MTPQVLVIGPGYVGREIIDLLLIDGKYAITALVRRQEAAKQLENDGAYNKALQMRCRLTRS